MSKLTTEQRLQRIGDRVYKARVSKGWSLQRLADESHCAKSTVYYIEQGRIAPTVTMLDRLSEALDLPFSYFVETKPQRRSKH